MDELTDVQRPDMDQREINQWCMFMHLGLLAGYAVPLGGLVVPIVLWQLKKDASPQSPSWKPPKGLPYPAILPPSKTPTHR